MPRRSARKHKGWLVGAGIACALLLVIVAVAMTGTDEPTEVADIPDIGVASWTAESFSGGPRLVADRTDVAYGPVDYGQQVEAVYRLRNVGDEVITIDEPDIKTLEGC